MKNVIIFIASFLLIGLSSCSKDEEQVSSYTELQKKALSVFNGTWADIQFSNLGQYPGANLQPDPDLITFGTTNSNPVEVYEDDFMNGKTLLFSSFGELIYHHEGYEDVACYYWVSNTADELRLYRKDTKKQYKKLGLTIQSETKMNLQDHNITLPYIFVKQ